MQKIISFDIGIKNMAYCFFSYEPTTEQIQIIKWDILNLMPQQKAGTATQKTTCCQCCKKSLYVSQNEEQTFCEKHAKLSPFFLPVLNLSSKTKEELQQVVLAKGYTIEQPDKKGALIEHIKNNLLKKRKKILKTGEVSLIDIGRRLNDVLTSGVIPLEDLNFVIIENQISKISVRMKALQGMLTQFFIIKIPEAHIEYISSHNKLKVLETTIQQTPVAPPQIEQQGVSIEHSKEQSVENKVKKSKKGSIPDNEITPVVEPVEKKTSHYAENKKQGVDLVKRICPQSHLEFFLSHKKKDDLADCFLQGVWFVKVKNK